MEQEEINKRIKAIVETTTFHIKDLYRYDVKPNERRLKSIISDALELSFNLCAEVMILECFKDQLKDE